MRRWDVRLLELRGISEAASMAALAAASTTLPADGTYEPEDYVNHLVHILADMATEHDLIFEIVIDHLRMHDALRSMWDEYEPMETVVEDRAASLVSRCTAGGFDFPASEIGEAVLQAFEEIAGKSRVVDKVSWFGDDNILISRSAGKGRKRVWDEADQQADTLASRMLGLLSAISDACKRHGVAFPNVRNETVAASPLVRHVDKAVG
jgi:hypothetical protein